MASFLVHYPNAASEVCTSDEFTSLEAFKNIKFGSVDPDEFGVEIIELASEEEGQAALAAQTEEPKVVDLTAESTVIGTTSEISDAGKTDQ